MENGVVSVPNDQVGAAMSGTDSPGPVEGPRSGSEVTRAGVEVVEAVAESIRRFRTEAGWSIGELARRAGVGKATVSTLEAGTANPSIETLVSISVALGVPFGALITEPRPVIDVQRAGDGPRTTSAAGMFASELAWSTGRSSVSELYRFEVRSGAVYQAEPHPTGVVETIVCCQGRVRLGPTTRPVELGEGDRISFPADQPHLYESVTDTAQLLALLTYR
jgi:transcriptional regulator with XRE-family HTH domain